ncbi:MAG: hypothetical protein K0M45_07170 [Candidatus Paracaedibacteraceae bacterium]|nr:hypothetical protein [Candidatus Paracaedibacteraceae bacterium]
MRGSVGGCWESALVRVTHWLPTLPHAAVLRGPALEQPRVGYSTNNIIKNQSSINSVNYKIITSTAQKSFHDSDYIG